jgi:hypothetical protein
LSATTKNYLAWKDPGGLAEALRREYPFSVVGYDPPSLERYWLA